MIMTGRQKRLRTRKTKEAAEKALARALEAYGLSDDAAAKVAQHHVGKLTMDVLFSVARLAPHVEAEDVPEAA